MRIFILLLLCFIPPTSYASDSSVDLEQRVFCFIDKMVRDKNWHVNRITADGNVFCSENRFGIAMVELRKKGIRGREMNPTYRPIIDDVKQALLKNHLEKLSGEDREMTEHLAEMLALSLVSSPYSVFQIDYEISGKKIVTDISLETQE